MIPLSFSQRRLWFLHRLVGPSATYNIPVITRIHDAMDVPALSAAIADVVARHEVLRTVYVEVDGEPVQRVIPEGEVRIDFAHQVVAEADLDAAVLAASSRVFDLAEEPPLAARLFSVGEREHVLVLTLHHIAGDGASMVPLSRDLSTAYVARCAGTAPGWEPLPVQYQDYTLWQRELLGAEDDPDSEISRQLEYWRTALDGLPEELALPTDFPRPATASYRAGRVDLTIDAATHAALVDLARTHDATLFMVVQAASAALLTRLGCGTDIPLGTVVSGRTDEALDDMVGFFVNSLVLRNDTGGNPTFAELVDRTRRTDLAAFDHQDLPFERLVEHLQPTRSLARHPLFQVAMTVDRGDVLALTGLNGVAEQPPFDTAKFDLFFGFVVGDDGDMQLKVTYAEDLFTRASAEAIGHRLVRLLDRVAAAPELPLSSVDILTDAERTRLLDGFNAATPRVPQETLPALFEQQVREHPDEIAVVAGRDVTYRELNTTANRLAHHLVANGVGPDVHVAVSMRRSPDLVTVMLAVAKAGGCYVPVEPAYPAARKQRILDETAPAVVIVDDEDHLPVTAAPRMVAGPGLWQEIASLPEDDPRPALSLDNGAYVIYTSGSTGTPKGAVLTHRGITRLQHRFREDFEVRPGSRVLQICSIGFDGSPWEILMALLAGGAVIPFDPDRLTSGDPADEALIRQTTHVTVTPSLLASLRRGTFPPGAMLIVAGEEVPQWLVDNWGTGHRLVNSYGPSEATVISTGAWLAAGEPVTLGVPVANTDLYVLDQFLQPVPVGVAGELYVAGPGLGRGYVGRPALTAARWVACPFGAPGEVMYRSGDVVRWLPDGRLVFVGRSDNQVKVRGFRIELGEIETALAAIESVRQAAVIVRTDQPGDKRLVAYVVPADGTVDVPLLRRELGARLPEYMVPSAFVPLDELPLTSNGKLDWRALPAPAYGTGAGSGKPRTARQEVLCQLFAAVLGLPEVGVDDNFFHLGGHSLLATRLANRIRSTLDVEMGVRLLFENPTVAGLEPHLVSGAVRPPLLGVAEPPEPLPLSFAQRRLWFLHRLEGASATYNVPVTTRLRGRVDVAALRAAVGDVVTRHEVLRTVYVEVDGEPAQRIVPAGQARVDFAHETVSPDELEPAVTAASARAFDLSTDLPLAVRLFSVGDEEHVLVLTLHHIAGDGVSMGPLSRDLSTAYAARCAGTAPAWAALPVQYRDYTLWQRELLGGADDPDSEINRQLRYWSTTLAGLPEELALPTDFPRPAQASYRAGRVDVSIDAATHARLRALARANDATSFMVVQAAIAALLTRMGCGTDIPLGTVVAGRADDVLDDLVGFFVNSLVLRNDTSGNPTFAELLCRVRDTDLTALDHQDLPFERLVEHLRPTRSLARHPLFQIALSRADRAPSSFPLAGLDAEAEPTRLRIVKFDLDITVSDEPVDADLAISIGYATDLFTHETAELLGTRLAKVLHLAAADPATRLGEFDILTDAERRLLTEPDDLSTAEPETVVAAFDAAVARSPHAVAVTDGTTRLSYGELQERAERLARVLRAAGVGTETTVPVLMERSPELVVAFLAILKAGGAYLPISAAYPLARMRSVDADSGSPVLVVDKAFADHELAVAAVEAGRHVLTCDHLLDDEPPGPLPVVRPAQLCYVMYTSGSTGEPKGIQITHQGVVDLIRDPSWTMGPGDRVLLHSPHAFDATTWEIWGPLFAGGTVVVAPPGDLDAETLRSLVRTHGVTRLSLTAGLFRVIADELVDVFRDLTEVTTGGDVISASAVENTLRNCPDTIVRTTYGPTEMTLCVTQYPWRAGEEVGPTVPLGHPMRGTRRYVLDEFLQPVPPGVAGELYLAGAGMARGYAGRPGLTAERFVACPFGRPGELMYRTGDMVRYDSAGRLLFLGRSDDQVKVRGFRVELGEIESALTASAEVRQAAVLAHADQSGEKQLVAYVVPATVDTARLRGELAARLPDYMVPAAFVPLDALPLTANGKLDRAALPAPVYRTGGGAKPENPRQETLCGLFADVLGLPEFGVADNFFDAGGHSLLATRLVNRIRSTLGVEMSVRLLFENPTVATLEPTLSTVRPARPALRRRSTETTSKGK